MKNNIIFLALFIGIPVFGQENTTREQDSIQESNIDPSEIPINREVSPKNQVSSKIYIANSYKFTIDTKQHRVGDSIWYTYHVLTYKELNIDQKAINIVTFPELGKTEINYQNNREVEFLILSVIKNKEDNTIEVSTHGNNLYIFEYKGLTKAKLLHE